MCMVEICFRFYLLPVLDNYLSFGYYQDKLVLIWFLFLHFNNTNLKLFIIKKLTGEVL